LGSLLPCPFENRAFDNMGGDKTVGAINVTLKGEGVLFANRKGEDAGTEGTFQFKGQAYDWGEHVKLICCI
jgi:hypothetical protein